VVEPVEAEGSGEPEVIIDPDLNVYVAENYNTTSLIKYVNFDYPVVAGWPDEVQVGQPIQIEFSGLNIDDTIQALVTVTEPAADTDFDAFAVLSDSQ
jgi:hypothetical protein